jgi:hypothetical protein
MATSPRPWNNNDYVKDSKSTNVNMFRRRKEMKLEKDIAKDQRNQIIMWNDFFRKNPHRFAKMYLNVQLYPYQIVMLYLMSVSNVFVGICARSAAKSFIVCLFAVIQCLLYPGSEIVIGASTLKQAGLIISSKLTMLRDNSNNLQREISQLTANMNNYSCTFINGSKITVVAANEGSRGYRASTLILDEFRILKKEIVDQVFIPFLYARKAPFMHDPKYSNLVFEPKTLSISSSWLKSDWWYKDTVETIKMVADGKSAGFFATDMYVCLKHGIKTANQIEAERRKADPISFKMEYLNEVVGQSNNAYFQLSQFRRDIKKAFYPQRMDETYNPKRNPFDLKKGDQEIRVVSMDFASRANRLNDNSIIICARLTPTHKGYQRQIVYIESMHGVNSIAQAARLKNIFFDFSADYCVLDIGGVGISAFDSLSAVTRDEMRGIDYPAFGVMESPEIDEKLKDELRARGLAITNIPVLFPISATQKSNSEFAVEMRTALQKKLFNFLSSEDEAEDYLVRTNKEFLENKEESTSHSWYLHPYVQTTLLVSECINLEMQMVNGMIKLVEPTSSSRKDRYSSLSYLNHLCSILDRSLLKEENTGDDWDSLQGVTFIF